MNRWVKLVLWTAVAAMLVMAVSAIVWRMQIPVTEAGRLPQRPLAPFILVAVPALFAVILVLTTRSLDARIPGISEDNTRHVQGAMVFFFLFVVACQAWMAFLYLGTILPGGDTFVRAAVVLSGVAMAVRGNFIGKLSRPAVKNPPDLGVWGRMARRMGLTLVALGSALAACAIVLPLRPLFFVMMATAAILVGISVAHRRAMTSLTWTKGSDLGPGPGNP